MSAATMSIAMEVQPLGHGRDRRRGVAVGGGSTRRSPRGPARAVDEVVAVLEAAGVPVGRVYQADDIAADPHYAERGMIQRLPVQVGSRELADVAFPGVVPRIDGTSGTVRSLGPTWARTPATC
jgi:hypothetical protein